MDRGNEYLHVNTASATVNAKTGPGILHTVCFNSPLAVSLTIYDGLNGTGNVIAFINTVTGPFVLFDAAFTVGLSVVTGGGGGAPDITITYR